MHDKCLMADQNRRINELKDQSFEKTQSEKQKEERVKNSRKYGDL